MGRKTVALSLDENIYDSYKKFCGKNSMILSRKIDQFMKDELKKEYKNAR
ncbi:MAG: hypothetical protein KKF44_01005 [Nanoarchaeota archaeon]|nr:hypothetical protein [Nanoarchaeota archaeon]